MAEAPRWCNGAGMVAKGDLRKDWGREQDGIDLSISSVCQILPSFPTLNPPPGVSLDLCQLKSSHRSEKTH